jgi:hypothetical protein
VPRLSRLPPPRRGDSRDRRGRAAACAHQRVHALLTLWPARWWAQELEAAWPLVIKGKPAAAEGGQKAGKKDSGSCAVQ